MPVRLSYGQELAGLDLSLRMARKIAIRGAVVNGVSGAKLASATITLERVDRAATGTMRTNARVEFRTGAIFRNFRCLAGFLRRVRACRGRVRAPCYWDIHCWSRETTMWTMSRSGRHAAEHWPGEIVAEGPGALPGGSAPRITLEPRSMNAAGVHGHSVGGCGHRRARVRLHGAAR